MVGHRKARVNAVPGMLKLEYDCKTGVFTKLIHDYDIEYMVHTKDMAWIHLAQAMCFIPNLKHPREDIVISGEDAVEALSVELSGNSIAAMKAYKSRMKDTVLRFDTAESFVVTTGSSVTQVSGVEAVIFQRTGGGMNTFDLLLCVRGNPSPVVVEYLEHDDMDEVVEKLVDHVRIYDYGPDPVPMAHLSTCFTEEGSWTAVIDCLDDSESEPENNDDSDYDSQESGNSTESSYMESDDEGSET